jgi:hypothetical protein
MQPRYFPFDMAADPQVRWEIDCFNADTLITEADGR